MNAHDFGAFMKGALSIVETMFLTALVAVLVSVAVAAIIFYTPRGQR